VFLVSVNRSCAVYRVLVGKPEGKKHLENVGVDGRIIIKCFLKKWDGGHELD
jgi:hypothetical protein